MSKTVPVRKRLYHSVPWRIDSPEFFLTICCAQPGINHLCRKSVASVVIGAAENYHLKRLWNLELVVLMPDHLHAIVSTGDRHSLEALVKSWKGWTAKLPAFIGKMAFSITVFEVTPVHNKNGLT